MDAIIARLFTSYRGKIRTFNETEATIKIVPFLAASNYRCSQFNKRRNDNSTDILLDEHKRSKLFYDPATLYLFMRGPALNCNKLSSGGPGQLVVPYVNTNAEYQPDKLMFSMNSDELDQFFSSKKWFLSKFLTLNLRYWRYVRILDVIYEFSSDLLCIDSTDFYSRCSFSLLQNIAIYLNFSRYN